MPVVRTSMAMCPVGMLERYVALAKIDLASELKLFRGIINSKYGERLRKSGGLSYTRLRELFLVMIEAIGLNPKDFGLHSLRAGGATAAVNAGVPDRLFKHHGRWKSKDGYVKDCLSSRLEVSKSLGVLLYPHSSLFVTLWCCCCCCIVRMHSILLTNIISQVVGA